MEHLFCDCSTSVTFYKEIEVLAAQFDITLPPLTFENIILQNHTCNSKNSLKQLLILLYKLIVFQNRSNMSNNNIHMFQQRLLSIETIEYKVACKRSKIELHLKKWSPLSCLLSKTEATT